MKITNTVLKKEIALYGKAMETYRNVRLYNCYILVLCCLSKQKMIISVVKYVLIDTLLGELFSPFPLIFHKLLILESCEERKPRTSSKLIIFSSQMKSTGNKFPGVCSLIIACLYRSALSELLAFSLGYSWLSQNIFSQTMSETLKVSAWGEGKGK